MLVCYLDDSGKDKANAITTVAGFVAPEKDWAAFEKAVEPIFAKYGVKVLHTMDLHQTTGEFEGWKVLKKQAFIYKLCREMTSLVPLGVSMSAQKEAYRERAQQSDRKRTVTPYTFCTNVIIDWMLTDIRIGKMVHEEGVAFALESGHQNNKEAEENFHDVCRQHNIGNILRSFTFADKNSCRAIQMADLLAFYSRRHGAAMERAPLDERSDVTPDYMMNIISGAVPLRSFVATDFAPFKKD